MKDVGEEIVLFVDDEEMILKSLHRVLRNEDFKCAYVKSGEEALRYVDNNHVSVVVSDQRMPGIKGVDLLRRIKQKYPEITRILLTGYSDTATAVEAINKGEVYRFLTKPWKPAELIGIIKEGLKISDKQRKLENFMDNVALYNSDVNFPTGIDFESTRTYRQFLKKTIDTLLQAIDARDHYTRGHSERVAAYAYNLATELGLPNSQAQEVSLGAMLHDIGKIGVDDAILRKPSKLSAYEWEKIKLHPEIGMSIVAPLGLPRDVVSCIYQHHERPDGQGYPNGIGGVSSTFASKIVAAVDVFDSMSSDRIYRYGHDLEYIISFLEDQKGKQLDTEVTNALLKMVKTGRLFDEYHEWDYDDHLYLYDLGSLQQQD